MKSKYQEIIKRLGKKRVKQGEILAKHTTFGIGGPADLFFEAKALSEIVLAFKLAHELAIPSLALGGGSNLLISDRGFQGLVVKLANARFKVQKEELRFKLRVGAGLSIKSLVAETSRLKLTGLEFMAGIPGRVGGAVRGNAGAWHQEIGDLVEKVRILDQKGQLKWLKKEDCQFSYRQSRFKKTDEIILEVKFRLRKGDRKKIEKMIKTGLEKRRNQPKKPSAGCVFINPKPAAAGILIDQCGLRGKRLGQAQISPQHANFIVNLGGAKAEEVVRLIKLAKKEVKKKFGLNLKEEIQLVGFDKLDKAG